MLARNVAEETGAGFGEGEASFVEEAVDVAVGVVDFVAGVFVGFLELGSLLELLELDVGRIADDDVEVLLSEHEGRVEEVGGGAGVEWLEGFELAGAFGFDSMGIVGGSCGVDVVYDGLFEGRFSCFIPGGVVGVHEAAEMGWIKLGDASEGELGLLGVLFERQERVGAGEFEFEIGEGVGRILVDDDGEPESELGDVDGSGGDVDSVDAVADGVAFELGEGDRPGYEPVLAEEISELGDLEKDPHGEGTRSHGGVEDLDSCELGVQLGDHIV